MLGVLPSLIGTLQATEVIKIILGIGEPLSGKLLNYDVLSNRQDIINFPKSRVVVKELSDYNLKCDFSLKEDISISELKKWLSSSNKFNLVDIREKYERDDFQLEDTHFIPMAEVLSTLNQIDVTIPTVFYCESGSKSKALVSILKRKGHKKVYSLVGGLIQWKMDS